MKVTVYLRLYVLTCKVERASEIVKASHS